MKSRLETLLRQRDLLREHLHWLEEEIASAGASPEQQRSPARPTTTTLPQISAGANAAAMTSAGTSTTARENAATNTMATADTLPELDAKGIHDEVRRGCLIYAAIAFACIAVIVALAFWKR
jgi:hypothetical protein